MDGANRLRQANAAVSAGQDHVGKSEDEFSHCARGGFAGTTWARTAWAYRGAAASGQDHLAKEIAKAIRVNHPDIVLILLLVDERPEEVTDLEREIDCQIYHSNFDESVHRHVQVAEMVLDRAKRLVEVKQDVVILLD